MTLQETDGRTYAQNDDLPLFGMLPCIFSDAERYSPTGLMPSIRRQLTLDSTANIFAPAGPAIAANIDGTGTPFSTGDRGLD